ncbi:ATP-binding protein [Actinacidiphila oryziradicis]|uniref:ATP-binding protein n=2 Tax=Actinacidiphila oryziradicis TaxID=2571141 RepID=A0A4U0SS65_9ACTN|nr:ATP-binding protein [Actinacidiphila oryziradicis]
MPPSHAAALGLVYTWTSATPGAPGRARTALRRALERLELSEDVITDAVLAASELVGNATDHATGPYEMMLRRTAVELICEVYDYDPRIPEIPAFPATGVFAPHPEGRGGGLEALSACLSERGRGLHIVDQLTGGAWGFRLPGDGTKVAWMVIPGA